MSPAPLPSSLASVADPREVGCATLLGVSASMKPAPGQATRSAVRSLLAFALQGVARVHPDVRLLDLREHPFPLFDGRMPSALEHPEVDLALACLARAGGILLAVPAYWSGVSGVFKNFVDVCCGPAYDMEGPARTVFVGKPTGLLVVGADEASAREGAADAERILTSVGARLVAPALRLANPRALEGDSRSLAGDLLAVAAAVVRAGAESTVPR